MVQFLLCDQHGIPVKEECFPDGKEHRKLAIKKDGFLYVNLDETEIEFKEGPTPYTKEVWSTIRDKDGNPKLIDIYIVNKS